MLIRIALMLVLLGVAACGKTVDTTIGDAGITAAVKTALLNNDTIDGTLVSVRTEAGVVYLEGVQPSAAAAEQLISIVRSVYGVREVRSSLTVDARIPTDPPPLLQHPQT